MLSFAEYDELKQTLAGTWFSLFLSSIWTNRHYFEEETVHEIIVWSTKSSSVSSSKVIIIIVVIIIGIIITVIIAIIIIRPIGRSTVLETVLDMV